MNRQKENWKITLQSHKIYDSQNEIHWTKSTKIDSKIKEKRTDSGNQYNKKVTWLSTNISRQSYTNGMDS